jgi:hypothetical protein
VKTIYLLPATLGFPPGTPPFFAPLPEGLRGLVFRALLDAMEEPEEKEEDLPPAGWCSKLVNVLLAQAAHGHVPAERWGPGRFPLEALHPQRGRVVASLGRLVPWWWRPEGTASGLAP